MTRFEEEALRDRVKSAVNAESYRAFARRAGVGLGVLRSFLDGNDSYFSNVLALSEAVGYELYLGPPRSSVTLAPLDGGDFAPIPIYEVGLAAGGGADNRAETVIAHLAFRRDWLRRMGVSPAAAVIARAQGRSMEPTIHDGDLVLIDRGDGAPPARPRDEKDRRPARIYALRDDGGARIKRLDLAAPGTLALLSDNPDHPPEFRRTADVQVIGRVVWWGHTDRE